MSDDGSRVYVATIGNPLGHGMVYIVDGANYTLVDSLTVGKENFGLIWRP
jgi:DNA-binding beta-propeller fold protein YncE